MHRAKGDRFVRVRVLPVCDNAYLRSFKLLKFMYCEQAVALISGQIRIDIDHGPLYLVRDIEIGHYRADFIHRVTIGLQNS